MLENLIFFFLSSEISKNFEKKSEPVFLEMEVSSIEDKINQDTEEDFNKF
jgi:hypothetical protein